MAVAMDPLKGKRSGSFSMPTGDSFDCDLTFESMALRGNPLQTPLPPQQFATVQRDSSSGSDTADALAVAGKSKNRQSARRSKSERLQGSKPRVKRRDRNLPLDLANSNSGSVGGGLSGDPAADPYSYLRKAPSASRLMADPLFNDTPDGSPRGLRRQGSNRPPLPAVALPASTPDTSPSLARKLHTSVSTSAFNSPSHPNINRLTQRNSERSPMSRAKDGSHRRAGSVRVSGSGSSATGTPITAIRRSTYLDVPDVPGPDDDINGKADEDSYRLRSFDMTRKGVVNRGDSFRRRRSRSNSLAPQQLQQLQEFNAALDASRGIRTSLSANVSSLSSAGAVLTSTDHADLEGAHHAPTTYRVAILGTHGVGKSALVSQFMTSECINAYERVKSDETELEESVFVMLNGEESELIFTYLANIKSELNRSELPHAYLLMYSVIDKSSFQKIEDDLARLQKWDALRGRALIVVGNKIDLVRSRAVSTQDGKCLACAYRGKFMEISVVINHNVDELLVGILTQIRLKEELQREIADGTVTEEEAAGGQNSSNSWLRNKGLVKASMKAKQMFSWLLGKDDDQYNNCENFQVL